MAAPYPDLPDPWGDATLVYFRPSGGSANQIGSCGEGRVHLAHGHPTLWGIHLGVCRHLHPTFLLCTRPVSFSAGNGPCLGFRKPKQPYQWLSYQEVSDRGQAPLCLSSQAWHLRGLQAPCWVSEGQLSLAWPVCQTPGSSSHGCQTPAWGAGKVSPPVRVLPGGLPPLLKAPCFLISSPHSCAGGRQG